MFQRWTALAVFFACLGGVGCNREYSPSAPTTPFPTEPAAPVPHPPRSAARVEIVSARITAFPIMEGTYRFGYSVRFGLMEAGGESGATIENVRLGIVDTFDAGQGCWRDRLRVPPGGDLDVFATDQGSAWLSYCAPNAESVAEANYVSLDVTFMDDDGQRDDVLVNIPVTR